MTLLEHESSRLLWHKNSLYFRPKLWKKRVFHIYDNPIIVAVLWFDVLRHIITNHFLCIRIILGAWIWWWHIILFVTHNLFLRCFANCNCICMTHQGSHDSRNPVFYCISWLPRVMIVSQKTFPGTIPLTESLTGMEYCNSFASLANLIWTQKMSPLDLALAGFVLWHLCVKQCNIQSLCVTFIELQFCHYHMKPRTTPVFLRMVWYFWLTPFCLSMKIWSL